MAYVEMKRREQTANVWWPDVTMYCMWSMRATHPACCQQQGSGLEKLGCDIHCQLLEWEGSKGQIWNKPSELFVRLFLELLNLRNLSESQVELRRPATSVLRRLRHENREVSWLFLLCYLMDVETCTVCMSGKCFATELISLAKGLEFKTNLA